MNVVKLVLLSIFLFGSSNLFAAPAPKVQVCHVGGDGTINLILVSANSNHLDNDSHNFDGMTDYEPSDIGASGEGTEDNDGDGIDEGCEPPTGVECPCWEPSDLISVNSGNQDPNSCGAISDYQTQAVVQNVQELNPEVEGGFQAANYGDDNRFCATRDFPSLVEVTVEEVQACMGQIADHCAIIGNPQ